MYLVHRGTKGASPLALNRVTSRLGPWGEGCVGCTVVGAAYCYRSLLGPTLHQITRTNQGINILTLTPLTIPHYVCTPLYITHLELETIAPLFLSFPSVLEPLPRNAGSTFYYIFFLFHGRKKSGA